MHDVQTPAEIAREWKAKGYTFRPLHVTAEFEAQACDWQRAHESNILIRAERLDPTDESLNARAIRAVAEQIRDHRACGNYTTSHRSRVAHPDIEAISILLSANL